MPPPHISHCIRELAFDLNFLAVVRRNHKYARLVDGSWWFPVDFHDRLVAPAEVRNDQLHDQARLLLYSRAWIDKRAGRTDP